jgi:hypothetical protein
MNTRVHPDLRFALVLAACALLAGSVQASKVRLVTVDEMTDRAAKIFYGRCIGIDHVESDDVPGKIGVYTFKVEQAVKGAVSSIETVRMIDPTGEMTRDGTRDVFVQGERAVLFLYGENAQGLTSPVGLGQGRFTVFEDKQGRKLVTNGYAKFESSPAGGREAMELSTLLGMATSRLE